MSDPVLEITFSGGIDESARSEIAEPGVSWDTLENGRCTKRGAYGKRLAYTSLGLGRLDATSRSAGNRVISHNDIICTIDGTHLDAYAEGPAVSVAAGRVPEAQVTTRTLSTTASSLTDVAHVNGYIATMTVRDNGASYETMLSVETVAGVVLRAPAVIATATGVNSGGALATYGAYFIAFTLREGSANIAAWYLDTTSAATITTGWVSIGNVATDKVTAGYGSFNIDVQGLTNRVAFVYVNSGGVASRVTVKTITIAGVLETATVNTASTVPDAVAVEGSIADTLWVAWHETTNVRVIGLDADVLATTLATTATVINALAAPTSGIYVVSSSTAGAGRVVVRDGTAEYLQLRGFTTSAGAVSASGTQTRLYDAQLDARPIQVGGRYYGLFRGGDDDTATLCDWTDTLTSTTAWLRPVAVAFPELTPFQGALKCRLHPISYSATSFAYASAIRRSSVGDSVELLTYDLATRKRWRSTSHNGSLYLASGILSYFDGRRVSETAFIHAPRAPVAADSAAGSGPNGTYRYVATYEDVDDDGNWSISSVSDPSNLLSIADNIATITMSPLVITNRLTSNTASVDKRTRVSLYRTKTGGEAPYFYLGSVENETTVPLTYSDSTTDTVIASNRALYGTGSLPGTNGSGQDRRTPPFCADVVSYNGRLVVASGSDLWESGQTVSGEGAWFSPAFTMPIPDAGDIVALAVQDGTLYAFKRRSIYALAGEAMSDNGASGGLGTPRKLAVDVGCIDVNSVVATSAGIFFQSTRGIELLTRGGGVVWIGEKIRDTLDTYPVVSSATLVDHEGAYVYFSLATTESGGRVSGDGRDLVFDLTLGAWISVDDKRGGSAHQASQDAEVVTIAGEPRYAWLGVNGTVFYQRLAADASAHLDTATWVTQRAVTPWIHVAGLQGEQLLEQILLLCERHTGHDLNISLAFDYVESFGTPRLFAAAELATLARQWLATEMTQTTSTAVKVCIEDATPSTGTVGSGKGSTWIATTIAGRPQRGPKRSSAAQRGAAA